MNQENIGSHTAAYCYIFASGAEGAASAYLWLLARLRGWWYRVKYLIQFIQFPAGKLFRLYGPLIETGQD